MSNFFCPELVTNFRCIVYGSVVYDDDFRIRVPASEIAQQGSQGHRLVPCRNDERYCVPVITHFNAPYVRCLQLYSTWKPASWLEIAHLLNGILRCDEAAKLLDF